MHPPARHRRRTSSLRLKLLLLPGLFLAGLLAVSAVHFHVGREVRERVVFPGFAEEALAGYQRLLRATVDIEARTLGARLAPLATRDEKIAALVEETDRLRFLDDKSGYFFAYDLEGVRLNVPINKSANGKNLIDAVDAKGTRFIAELIRAARGGGGFVRYYFEKEGSGVQPKLGYAALIPGTDFMVGTGIYIDGVEADLAALRTRVAAGVNAYHPLTLGVSLAVLALTVGASVFLGERIGRAIRRVIGDLGTGGTQISAAAGHVSAASQTLAQGACEQAASLHQTGASLEKMAEMTRRNTEGATEANKLARAARASADEGTNDIAAMSGAMAEIRASSDDIAKIIKTIDEIAFQTNLLALNAAVEAARAGEAGAGFSVVAEEVRALARRSAEAARETAEKIEGAIRKTGQGVVISEQVKRRLADIVGKVRAVDELVDGVARASAEQTEGVTQISSGNREMDRVVQANAASAEESAAAAEELNAQASTLAAVIEDLRLLVEGGRAESVASGPKGLAPSA